jgi:hypothetical protein
MSTQGLEYWNRVREVLLRELKIDPNDSENPITPETLQAGLGITVDADILKELEDFLKNKIFVLKQDTFKTVCAALFLEPEDFKASLNAPLFREVRSTHNTPSGVSPGFRKHSDNPRFKIPGKQHTTIEYPILPFQERQLLAETVKERTFNSLYTPGMIISALGIKKKLWDDFLNPPHTFDLGLQDKFLNLCALLNKDKPQKPPISAEDYMRELLRVAKVTDWEEVAAKLIAINAIRAPRKKGEP